MNDSTAGNGQAERVRVGHFFLGIEGLAMLRSWPEDADGLDARTEEMVEWLAVLKDDEQSPPFLAREVDTETGYAVWAPTYDEGHRPNPMFLADEPILQELIKALPSGRALDAACGTGRWARFLVEAGHQVTGVDVSTEMLDVSRSRVPQADFRLGSIETLPFQDSTFDSVTCALALTHLKTLDDAFREFSRVLVPGGTFVLSDVHPFFTAFGFHAFYTVEDGTQPFVRNNHHPLSMYAGALSSAGLMIRSIEEGVWTESILSSQPWTTRMPEAAREALLGLPLVLAISAIKNSRGSL